MNLGTILKIEEIQPILKADRVVRARVLTDIWLVTGTMNNFCVGDLVVYIKPNVFVPETTATWLCDPDNPDIYQNIPGGSVKLSTIRGFESNGLIMPLVTSQYKLENVIEGDDVTDILGLRDWATIPLA